MMGLDDFMELDTGSDEPEESSPDDEEEQNSKPQYEYTGDKDLLDVSWSDIMEVVESTDYGFNDEVPVGGFDGLSMESQNGTFFLTIHHPWGYHEYDCVLVAVIDAESGYDVIEPYPVYFVDGWEEELKQAINKTIENQEELVECQKCGSVMVIRETNITGERIRGCSSFPGCRNKEKL